jgi:hypothetical protein
MICPQIDKQIMIRLAVTVLFLIAGCSCSPLAQRPLLLPLELSGNESIFDQTHLDFDRLLEKYVSEGLVDYRAIQEQPDLLASYLASLAAVDWNGIEKWSREEQLAFWINAYNAFTIQAIVERYPIRSWSFIGMFSPRNSILQISGVWTRLSFNVGGHSLTLGHIEHEILRKDFAEPRIHFAIACASTSCPALRSEAYRSDILERQLHDQTIQFINDPDRGVRFDAKRKRVYVSKIFKWFSEDFSSVETTGHPILAYISPYLRDNAFTEAVEDGDNIRLCYLPYDWNLNEKAGFTLPVVEKGDKDG